MSITDELRTSGTYRPASNSRYFTEEELTAIADRIDAEHEAACAEAYGNGVMSVPIALDESAWVELPKDADGEYIHIGDKVTCGASVWEVTGFRFTGGFWGIFCTIFNDQGGSGTNVYPPSDLHHYQPPTIEDVLREFAEKITDSQIPGMHPTYEEAITEYAAKLQLREVDE